MNKNIMRIINSYAIDLPEIDNMKYRYGELEEVIHLPNGDILIGDHKNIINNFLDNKTDMLDYRYLIDIDHDNKIIHIYILPIVESA